jgi:hypothetical protein
MGEGLWPRPPRAARPQRQVRVMMVARALMRHQEKGKSYGKISAKAPAVLTALLWRFHNAATAIAEAAGCARGAVYKAIRALEQVGVPSWVNRIKRVREYVPWPVRQPGATTLHGAGSPAALSFALALARLAGKAAGEAKGRSNR